MMGNNDPRMRYYFTRQNSCTPGSSCNAAGNAETLFCSLEVTPAHMSGTPTEDYWCYLENGYWGRMHGVIGVECMVTIVVFHQMGLQELL